MTHVLEKYGNIPIDIGVLSEVTSQYKFPRNKIASMEKRGEIIRLKKGLYVISDEISHKSISHELVANHLYGASYISLETALAYYGMIPERVYTVRSMTTKRAKQFSTPLGNFEYKTVSSDYFSIGLRQEIIENRYAFLIATPTKAVCDIIVATPNLRLQSVRTMQTYLLEDLRIGFNTVKNLDESIVEQCVGVGRKKIELEWLLKSLKNNYHTDDAD
jgi:predicted transcriptional regulator of viral defense system